jgi:hypothetical protein
MGRRVNLSERVYLHVSASECKSTLRRTNTAKAFLENLDKFKYFGMTNQNCIYKKKKKKKKKVPFEILLESQVQLF